MLLEQEIASIIKFALTQAENPSPYYYNVPEDFVFPAMYFPQPEIRTRGETFRTYAMEYAWYINVFCETTEEAHAKAWAVLSALKRARNLVPIIGTDGAATGEKLRLDDPEMKPVDTGVVQLTLSWTSRRPYNRDDAEKVMEWEVEGWQHPDVYRSVEVETAFESAINHYVRDYPHPEHTEADGPGV